MGVFAYFDPETSGIVYYITPNPESEASSSSVHSETETTESDLTIGTDDVDGYFVLHHGRRQPASENGVKWFPADNIRRFILRYLVLKFVFGGDYIGPVKHMLAPVDGRVRQVVELGTRTGSWIQAMAVEFPHVRFRSLDVVPLISHTPCHNITFEVYDFSERLLLRNESQDAVFLNIALELVKDYRALLREVYRVLRPGGLIYILDFNPHLWDARDAAIPAQRTNPNGYRFWESVRQQISKIGIDPDTVDKLPQWLAPGSDLWDNGQGGFTDIDLQIRSYPAYPHDGFPCMDEVDEGILPFLKHLTFMSMRDMSGLVKDSGVASEEAEALVEGMLEELKHHEMCARFKLHCIYAIRI